MRWMNCGIATREESVSQLIIFIAGICITLSNSVTLRKCVRVDFFRFEMNIEH